MKDSLTSDSGSAPAGIFGALAICLIALIALLGVGVAARAHSTSQTAADLAALAAADSAATGHTTAEACAIAANIASRHGTQLHACSLNGPVASIEVRMHATIPILGFGQVSAHSRAGPEHLRGQ